jgi:hypothetical protein
MSRLQHGSILFFSAHDLAAKERIFEAGKDMRHELAELEAHGAAQQKFTADMMAAFTAQIQDHACVTCCVLLC